MIIIFQYLSNIDPRSTPRSFESDFMIVVYICSLFTGKMVLDAELLEAKRVYALPFEEHGKLIQQRPFQDNRELDYKKMIKDKDALDLYDMYYPDGLPSPKPQPNTSPEKPPPDLHAIDKSITPSGYQRRTKKTNRKRATRKDVSDYHDQFRQQSQLPEHASQDLQPELIQNHMSGYNPYPVFQGHDPNGYPNPHYHWDHHGGSGPDSTY